MGGNLAFASVLLAVAHSEKSPLNRYERIVVLTEDVREVRFRKGAILTPSESRFHCHISAGRRLGVLISVENSTMSAIETWSGWFAQLCHISGVPGQQLGIVSLSDNDA
jgi:hypothetical protein